MVNTVNTLNTMITVISSPCGTQPKTNNYKLTTNNYEQ